MIRDPDGQLLLIGSESAAAVKLMGLCHDSIGDLHELLLADPEALDVAVGVVVEPDSGHQLLGALPGRQPVDATASSHLVAKEDVLGDGQLGDERKLLVDDDDACAFAVADVRELGWLAFEEDLSLVRAVGMDA